MGKRSVRRNTLKDKIVIRVSMLQQFRLDHLCDFAYINIATDKRKECLKMVIGKRGEKENAKVTFCLLTSGTT